MKLQHICGTLVLSVSCLVFCGCELESTIVIYSGDIEDVLASPESKTDIHATLNFLVPILGTENCDDDTEKFRKVTSGIISGVEIKGCVDRGYDSFLSGSLQVPIWKGSDQMSASSLFTVLVIRGENLDAIALVTNTSILDRLDKKAEQEFFQSVDLKDMIIRVELNNDTRDAVDYAVQSVFLDNDPIVALESATLERRSKVQIKLSDVATARLAKYENIVLFFLLRNSEESTE